MAETRRQLLTRRLLSDAINRGWALIRSKGAIAPGTRHAERFGTFGRGAIIAFPTGTLYGEGQIHLGADTMVCSWATLATGYSAEQATVPPRALVLGDRCVVGLRSGLVAHESIEVGDDVWFGQDVFVTDSNHGFEEPDVPIGRQLGTHQPVSIGSGSWIGHGAIVLPGTTIGRHVVVAAGSVVRGDIPDHTVVGGVPARVIRTYVPGAERVRVDDVERPSMAPAELVDLATARP